MTVTVDGPVGVETAHERLTAWGARLDQAVAGIQELPGEQRAIAENFALALDSLSREALTTIVRTLKADPRGKELLFELVDDETVRFLLGMHGIIRLPDPEQAERVRDGVGEDGSVAAPPQKRAFFSLESMLRGPREAGGSCGCGGAAADPNGDPQAACGCGGH